MQTMSAGKVKGIDVSHHNGAINWAKVKQAGYQFVYCKATESTNFTDNKFLTNAKGAKAAGLHVGAYHFARPSGSVADGTAEAKYFVSVLKQANTDLLPCLDLEASKLNASQTAAWVDAFAAHVKSATGKAILLYTGLWFMNQLGGDLSTKLSKYPLWVSYYRTSAPPNNGWTSWTMWQYTDKGSVPGISGGVDVNVATSLDALKGGTATVTDKMADDMYDLSCLKDYKLVGLQSSKHPSEINQKVSWAMGANANCVLLLKRGFDLRQLKKALDEMYPPE
jgi:GH25 family lysozyme M1 (1,4-beta-N-acetylmuramidase)